MVRYITEKMIHKNQVEIMIKKAIECVRDELVNIKQKFEELKKELNGLKKLLNVSTILKVTKSYSELIKGEKKENVIFVKLQQRSKEANKLIRRESEYQKYGHRTVQIIRKITTIRSSWVAM